MIEANKLSGGMFDLPPEPEIDPQFIFIWRAWHRLSHSRVWASSGFGSMPKNIPWEVVHAYCQAMNIESEWEAILDDCLMAMDAVFIGHIQKAMKRSMGGGEV